MIPIPESESIPEAFRVSLESESESRFQSKPGIGIGIKTLPESCITGVNGVCAVCVSGFVRLALCTTSMVQDMCALTAKPIMVKRTFRRKE